MNREILKQVRDHIAEHPAQFNMDLIGSRCGGCIASHIFGLMGVTVYASILEDWLNESRELADLTEPQAKRLFLQLRWPEKFKIAYRNATTNKARAHAAVRRINHFLRTDGRD